MAESRAIEAQGVNPVPASNRPSHPASWLSVADEGGVAPLALADPHGFRNRPWTAQAHASVVPAFTLCLAGAARAGNTLNTGVDATGESNPVEAFAAPLLSVCSVAKSRADRELPPLA